MTVNIGELVKPAGDITALVTLWAVLVNIITAAASLFTLIWTIMRLYEMITGLPFHQTHIGLKVKSLFKSKT